MMELRIELLSPLCSASGTSGPGAVDREIVFDNHGLPYFARSPDQRLLRDAYSELEQSGLGPLPEGALLFGTPGQFARSGQDRRRPARRLCIARPLAALRHLEPGRTPSAERT